MDSKYESETAKLEYDEKGLSQSELEAPDSKDRL